MEHFILILDLPESLFDYLDFVVSLLNERLLARLRIGFFLESFLHRLEVALELLDFLFLLASDLHELPSLFLFFLETLSHVKQI